MWQVSQEWSTKCLESIQQEDFLQSLLDNLQRCNSLLTEKGRSILGHTQLFQSSSLYLAKIYLPNLLSLLISVFLLWLPFEHSYYSSPVFCSLGRTFPVFFPITPCMKLVWATSPSWSVLLPCVLIAWAHNRTMRPEQWVWLSSSSCYHVLSNGGYAHLVFLGRHTTPLTKVSLTPYRPASPKLSVVCVPLVELAIALTQ